ncbi:MAG TPA: hypothetical protein VIG24_17470 [Acidimicrobiia bacterium]
MPTLPERLTRPPYNPGPPCSVRLLIDNVTDEDRTQILEAIAMIKQARAEKSKHSSNIPNSRWLANLLHEHLGVYVSAHTIQRHISGRCRCRYDTG